MERRLGKADNGLNVITIDMPFVKSVVINLLVRVGSRYETQALEGITHFLEHMAFKGTNKRSYKQIAEEFDHIGGSFNAYTSKEYTVYEVKVLNQDIRKALDILSDIIEDSVFLPEEIEKERKVIIQEIAQCYDDPQDFVFEQLSSITFKEQPLGKSILGTEQTLNNFQQATFKDYVKDYYSIDNMYLAAAGDVRHDEFMKIAKDYFKKIGARKTNTAISKPEFQKGFKIDSRPHLEQTQLVLAYEGIGYLNLKDFYIIQMIAIIFGGGISSRLFQEIRENKALCYSVSSFVNSYTDAGLFCIYAATNHDKLKELIDALSIEVKKLSDMITDDEMARARAQVNAGMLMCQEKPSYQCDNAIRNYALHGRFIDYKETLDYINNLTKKDLLDFAVKIFSKQPALSLVGDKFTEQDYERTRFII